MGSSSGWSFADTAPPATTPNTGQWSFADEVAPAPTEAQRQYAPGAPPAPLAEGLKSDAQKAAEAPWATNPRTGGRYKTTPPGQSVLDPQYILEHGEAGIEALATPAEEIGKKIASGGPAAIEGRTDAGVPNQTPGLTLSPESSKAAARGATELIKAGTRAATPLLVATGMAAPLPTLISLAAGVIAQKGVQAGLDKLGVAPEYADLGADIAGLIAGYAAGKVRLSPQQQTLVEVLQGKATPEARTIDALREMVDRGGTDNERRMAQAALKRKFGMEYGPDLTASAPEAKPEEAAAPAPKASGWSFADESPEAPHSPQAETTPAVTEPTAPPSETAPAPAQQAPATVPSSAIPTPPVTPQGEANAMHTAKLEQAAQTLAPVSPQSQAISQSVPISPNLSQSVPSSPQTPSGVDAAEPPPAVAAGTPGVSSPAPAPGAAAPKGWDSVAAPEHERHPSVDLSDEELKTRAANKPLPLPDGAPASMTDAWNTVSRIVPDLAAKLTKVFETLPPDAPENGVINVKTGELRIKPGTAVTPETLWHELIHLDQPEAQAGRMALDPDRFNSLEVQAQSGIKEALARFRAIDKPTGNPAANKLSALFKESDARNPASAGEPSATPPAPGMVRMYRGQAQDYAPVTEPNKPGTQFTTDRDFAKFYSGGKPLLSVDIPEHVFHSLEAAQPPPGISPDVWKNQAGRFLPESWANRAARELPTTTPAGAKILARIPSPDPDGLEAVIAEHPSSGGYSVVFRDPASGSFTNEARIVKTEEQARAFAAKSLGIAPETGPHGPITHEYAGNPADALTWVRSGKTGFAQDAVPHSTIGPIGLAYGKAGDAANDWKGGYGVAHIDAKHPGWLDANLDKISAWPVDQEFRNSTGRVTAVRLSGPDGNRVMVSRDWMGQPHPQWMLTGYERSAPATSVGVRGTPEGAAPTPAATDRPGSIISENQSVQEPEGHASVPLNGSAARPVRTQEAPAAPAPKAPARTPEQVASKFAVLKDALLKLAAPAARTEGARSVSYVMREMGAKLAREDDIAQEALRSARDLMFRRPVADRFEWVDRIETREPQPNVADQRMGQVVREMLDEGRDKIIAMGKGYLEKFYENYFPHAYKNPTKAQEFMTQFFEKRPLQGSKAFLKRRTFPTFRDAMEAGLEPISDNPIDIVLIKLHEMAKFRLGHEAMDEMKADGHLEYFSANAKAPAGYKRIDDAIATVYGKPTVTVEESYDQALMDQLNSFAASLGIRHTRDVRVSGPGIPRGALGFAGKESGNVKTKFGSPESVLAHEIGHQIEYKYGISRAIKGPGIAKELNALADLRFEGSEPSPGYKSYTRGVDEKMANAIATMLYAPERFQEVAPKTWDLLRDELYSHPDLRPLLDVRKSMTLGTNEAEVPVGGMVIRGYYWGTEDKAAIVNNFLSPGLRGNPIYDAYMAAGNTLNQAQLGLSAFHLGTTTMEAAISKDALALRQLAANQKMAALKSHIGGYAAPFLYAIQGNKLLREWMRPGTQGGDFAALVDAAIKAGARARQDKFYESGQYDKMADAFRRGGWGSEDTTPSSSPSLSNLLGGYGESALRSPFGMIDLTSRPLMHWLVPRLKMGAFADIARFEMSRLPEGATAKDAQAALTRAWDSIDNRLGQMVYDNLFWNKIAKDMAMASVRAVGWDLGSLREGLGGIADATMGNSAGERVTNRSAYLVGMVVRSAIVGAMIHYLLTGERPHRIKDYFFPGGHSVPGFFKDAVNYATHPIDTAKSKIHPLMSLTYDFLSNVDAYGKPITDEDWYTAQHWLDMLDFTARDTLPIAIRNAIKEGAPTEDDVFQFFGMPKEPRAVREDE